MNTCLKCIYYGQSAQPNAGNCYANPPTVEFIAVVVPLSGLKGAPQADVRMQPATARPMVLKDDRACRRFVPLTLTQGN